MYRAGDTLGPYTFMRKIGRGNFGVVWLAEKRSAIATTQFALKLPLDDDIDIEAIKQEAALWSHVSGHPNILPIIEADIYDEQIVIASEYAPDGSLADWIKAKGGKAPSYKAAIEMTSGILAGLERLHSKQIIHRDLKPRNILLQGETPRLADFGLARLLRASVQSNLVAGTPAYMAPEAFKGVRSEQTDLWAAAIIFYEMLVGRLPYLHQETETLVYAIMHEEPQPLPASIPEPLREMLARALQREPDARYKTAAEMREAILDAGLRVITGKQVVAVSALEGNSVASESDEAEEEMTRRVARVETELISERVKQLAAEGAQAFAIGHYAIAVEKWESALRLSPEESSIRDSLETAKQMLAEAQRGGQAVNGGGQAVNAPQADGAVNAANAWTFAAGAPGTQMQPDTQATQWPAPNTQPLQSFGQASAQHPYDSGSRVSGQAPVANRRWLRRAVVIFALLVVVGAALAAVFYFKIFQSKTSLIVSKDGAGDYKTISEAIKRAEPGARILVRAGTYTESLVLDKRVEIAGDAASNAAVIIESADAPCVVMKTEQATVRGLTLRGRAASKGGKHVAVDIPQGQLLVENCRITSDTFACIAVHGATANPMIRASMIREGSNEGIIFYDKAQGTVENCDITANAAAGVVIRDGANPTIRASRIYNGNAKGVLVAQQGIGVIEDCDVYGHKEANVEVVTGGNPTVRRGKIHSGKSIAVRIDESGQGTFDGVEIFGGVGANVEISGASNPTLRGCNIHSSQGAGVHISKNSQGALDNCEIHNNESEGIKIEASNPAIRRCKVYESGDEGVNYLSGSAGTMEASEIYNNAGVGVSVSESSPVLRGCKVRDGKADGVKFSERARGTIDNCDIFANAAYGIVIEAGCVPEIKGSRIKRNGSCGVMADMALQGNVIETDLTENANGGWCFDMEPGVAPPIP